ncbi:hypothetical protein [Streptomyces seoulensis]|uniref:hypothetical protein n=1 Tax=Streptomyces seoulensis TaxID=73044 RepID=UPI001FCBD87D|nr:hypothetical protein [Streptomyces seoulensis]
MTDARGHVRMRTVFDGRSVRGGLLAAATAGSLLLGVTGCGGGEDNDGLPKDYKVVSGTQLCGGNAISAEASRALKVITGSSRFEASSAKYTVAQAASDLVQVFPTVTDGNACRIFTPIGTRSFQLRITWSLVSGAPTSAPASKFTVLKMGERTVTATEKAYVFFACRSPRLLDSTNVAHIALRVEYWGMPKDPQDNVEALKNAYATVAHSYSLAMAKELRCEKNGGLPAKPVLEPA